MKKYIAIVDAFSSGATLASEWKKKGFSCIHIQSNPYVAQILTASYHPTDFGASLLHENQKRFIFLEMELN